MRLTAFLITISTLSISAKSYSQEVNLSLQNVPVEKVFKEIREQTGYSFLWAQQTIKDLPLVSVSIHGASLNDAVKACLKGLPLTYGIRGKVVFIERKIVIPLAGSPNLLPAILPLNVIVGLVTDSSGSPLPGVTVYVKSDAKIGTVTDANGRYVLQAPDKATLVFRMVGFESQEIPVKDGTDINIKLLPVTSELGETVVVAFGTQKKEDVVGAITTIDPKELKTPSSNLTTALAGRLAGIIAYQRSGEPGKDNAKFFIRGVTTFGYKQDPLILIDNIESTTTDLARLQPDDIAGFSILKDATATALYGSRAANGVILIKTKEGKEGKANISLRIENSISAPTRNVKLSDPITYMQLADEAVTTRNPLGVVPYLPRKIDNTIAHTNPYAFPATDWQDELLKKYTTDQRVNLNISGGGRVARYYVSGSYNKDNGLLNVDHRNNFNNNINLKSYSLRTNLNITLTKSTEVNARISGNFDDYAGPIQGGAGVYSDIMHTNPVYFPPYFPTDSAHDYVKHIMFGNYGTGEYLNPYGNLVSGYKNYSQSTINAQFEVKQHLMPGLDARAMINTSRYTYFDVSRAYNPYYYAMSGYDKLNNTYSLDLLNETTATEYLDYSEGVKNVSSTVYGEAALSYNHVFHQKHTLSAMAVGTMRSELDGNAGDVQLSLPHRNVGFAGRATYYYSHKYFFEFNFGYNASERFYKTHRWGFFPSAGIAWEVSNEKFWKPLQPIISRLKFRATYGLVGNDAVGSPDQRFFYISNVNMNDVGYGTTFGTNRDYSLSGVSISRYPNFDITWEKAYKTDLGIEMTLFNTVEIEADYFKQHRTNIFMDRSFTPATMGLSVPIQANLGAANAEGIEGSIDYSKNINPHVWIKARGNFTYAASKFEKYSEPDYSESQKYLSRIGYPISQQWGYIAERLFIDDQDVANSPKQEFGEYAAGDIKYRDINRDGKITTLDQVPVGHPTDPEITYGFGISVGIRQFDISCFFQGLARESFWIDAEATSPFINNQTQLLKVYADNHWSENNRNNYALWPRLSPVVNVNDKQPSTWFMRNGTFLRLKQVEVGYTFPGNLIKKVNLTDARLYLNSSNLFLISSFKLWDVEMGGNGLGYPIQRVFNAGLQISL